MILLTEIKATTEILLKGAFLFALMDALLLVILTRFIKYSDFLRIKWRLVIFMAVFFSVLFGLIASYIFWDSVYCYVFPAWSRWVISPAYGLLFAAVGLFVWEASIRLRNNAVLSFCLFGGLWGMITHIWAIYRGLLDKPPMLKGASPLAVVIIAIFEFIFYWCICLGFTFLLRRAEKRFRSLIKRNRTNRVGKY